MSTLATARDLVSALDRNDPEAVAAQFAPGATWWVDSGPDRAAGRFGCDPGERRSWPLHGAMPAHEKSRLLVGLDRVFPGGLRQIERRSFAGGDLAVVEAAGEGLFRGERAYRNRYAFVVEVGPEGVVELREYMDTAHAADVFGMAGQAPRQPAADDAQPIPGPGPSAATPAGAAALSFLAAISAADPDRLAEACTDDATWWADGGRERTAGPEAAPEAWPERLYAGRVAVAARAGLVANLERAFPSGYALTPHRLIEQDGIGGTGLVAVEAEGHGRHRSGRLYQNRYCWVMSVQDGRIREVREYCDTLHGFDIFGLAAR